MAIVMHKRRTAKKRKEPPFTIAAAVVGIAATAYSVHAAAKRAKEAQAQGREQQTTTNIQPQTYPAETLNRFRSAEAPVLGGALGSQAAILAPLWGAGGMGTEE